VSGYLLDTNAISMFSPSRASATPEFAEWMAEQEQLDTIFLSVVSLHEIEKGVRLLDHKGATAKATGIRYWLAGLVAAYSDNILTFDSAVAKVSGQLEAAAIAAGHNPGMADAIIAATAKVHGLAIITSNLKHFQPFGVDARSPQQLFP
jgi:predicted nucleic acid-binding protein